MSVAEHSGSPIKSFCVINEREKHRNKSSVFVRACVRSLKRTCHKYAKCSVVAEHNGSPIKSFGLITVKIIGTISKVFVRAFKRSLF